ncbi:hypothetical protein T01_9693 [Trichinella spiralis]|uniref:Uncharacterized protein n=1 Tax=Trichinella spiralis TaxID=6334 RepID=A0A0V0Z1C8_TRISP|nr:hypothetical protein T01_9693 [Trichinella spiralis]
MNSTNQAQKRLKLLQIHFAVDIALFDALVTQEISIKVDLQL